MNVSDSLCVLCPRIHQMPDKGGKVCGGDAGQVVKALTVGLFCVEQVVLKQNYRLCPGIPFSYTILNPRKALQPFCHFICWSRTPAPVLLQSAPRNSWK